MKEAANRGGLANLKMITPPIRKFTTIILGMAQAGPRIPLAGQI